MQEGAFCYISGLVFAIYLEGWYALDMEINKNRNSLHDLASEVAKDGYTTNQVRMSYHAITGKTVGAYMLNTLVTGAEFVKIVDYLRETYSVHNRRDRLS